MYVEYSARVFKKYRSHNVSHTAQVYNVLYTYCGGCAGFQSKDSLHSLYSLYIYIYMYIDFVGYNFYVCTDMVLHAEFKKCMRALARANRNYWPRTAIFSTSHVRYNDIVRAVLR